MYLNTLKPAEGSKKVGKRVGRGIGSGLGKTCGRGHKGQHARSGGYHKVGFEGGQMPLQRRLPKFGFTSRKSRYTHELRLCELNDITEDTVDLALLKSHGIVESHIKKVKIIAKGELKRAVNIVGLHVTAGALTAIQSAGGKVQE